MGGAVVGGGGAGRCSVRPCAVRLPATRMLRRRKAGPAGEAMPPIGWGVGGFGGARGEGVAVGGGGAGRCLRLFGGWWVERVVRFHEGGGVS